MPWSRSRQCCASAAATCMAGTAIAGARALLDDWNDWEAYPASWPRTPGAGSPKGMISLNQTIRDFAALRLARIRRDLEQAGSFYPRASVRETLHYWKIQ